VTDFLTKTGIAFGRIRGNDVIISALILLSFFHYSEYFYPWLNADAAVKILIAVSFSRPGDFYFWGQDRGGSLVPMLGHWIYSLPGMSLVLSVSLAHYLIILSGFLAISNMLKNDTGKVILALFWFLPAWHQHYFLVYNFLALQTSLTAVSVFLCWKSLQPGSDRRRLFFLFATGLGIFLLCWVSELAFLSLLLLPVLGMNTLKKRKDFFPWISLAAFTILTAIVLQYARTFATHTAAYHERIFAGKEGIISNIRLIISSLVDIILFRSETGSESIHLWMLMVFLPPILWFRAKHGKESSAMQVRPLIFYFLLNAMAILLFLLSSHWIYLNGTGRWYFVPVYYSILVALLFYLDPVMAVMGRFRRVLLLLVAASASLTGLYPMYFPKRLPAKFETVSQLKKLGEAGFIGDYWNAYVIACVNPGHLAATPHDRAYIRQAEFPGLVLSKPKLYLVRDQWLDNFPDSIPQFGKLLYKDGEEFQLGDCSLCKYRKKD